MKKIILLACIVVLAGCAVPTKVVSSSPRTVAVQSFKGMQEAQASADAECGKYNRLARWAAGTSPNFIFDCVN